MKPIQILWVDDEVDLLKPHFIFLETRGYAPHPCTNGQEAIELVNSRPFDVVLLDENMPGLNGLETLQILKSSHPDLPVIMVTKNEEEKIMEEAIGSKISDYLIKPVNPNQILLSLKKTLNHHNLISEKTSTNYLQEFQKISLELLDITTADAWCSFYKKLVYWQMELQGLDDTQLLEISENQRVEANVNFCRFIQKNYPSWIANEEEAPLLSQGLFKKKVLPELKENTPTLLLVIDNLRWDQWKSIAPHLSPYYKQEEETMYFSILPTATQYSRNTLFSGLLPAEIKTHLPQFWKDDIEEGGKNLFEEELLVHQCNRFNVKGKVDYKKITNLKDAKGLIEQLQNYKDNTLLAVVYNFVDMISHAKSEMEIIKELAADDKSYRALTETWFKNSPLLSLIQKAKQLGFQLMITTDHGTINTQTPREVVGDKESSLNLRYKTGRNLNFSSNKIMQINDPKAFGLPSQGLNSSYIFAKEADYFVYPKNYNYYANLFKNTYQHGGVSLEEILIPFVFLTSK